MEGKIYKYIERKGKRKINKKKHTGREREREKSERSIE